MSFTTTDIELLAERQVFDYERGTPGTLFADGLTLTVGEAYQVQAASARIRSSRGDTVLGYKVGCTSPVIQQQLAIESPIFGRLFASEQRLSGVELAMSAFDHPAVEGELAVVLSDHIEPAASTAAIASAIQSIFPVIELHNFIFRGPALSAAELIANNGLNAGFVAPAELTHDLPAVEPPLLIDIGGVRVDEAEELSVSQGIVKSLRWLADSLAAHGEQLRPGQTVLTGSRAGLLEIESPGAVSVNAGSLGRVECEFVP